MTNLPLHQFLTTAWFTLIGLSCGNAGSNPDHVQVREKSIAQTIYTQSILSEIDPQEMFSAKFLEQIIPLFEEEGAMVIGIFKPVYLQEFAPFSHLKPDELLVMIAWKPENISELDRKLSRSLSTLKNEIEFRNRFFKAVSQEKINFSQPGFYTHKMGNTSRKTAEVVRSGQLDNQWIFQEIADHTSMRLDRMELCISRHASYEDWTTSTLGNNSNTSGSIGEALNQYQTNGQIIASRLLLSPSYSEFNR